MSPPPPPTLQRPSPSLPLRASELTRLLGADPLSPPTPVCFDRPGVHDTRKPGMEKQRGEAGVPEGLISSPDQGAASQSLLSLGVCFPELPTEFS